TEKVRPHVGDSSHQEASGAPAAYDEAVSGGPTIADELLGAGNEIFECVHFVHQPSLLVPGPSHFPAAAHVRYGENEPALEQVQPRLRKGGVDGDLVAAVAVKKTWCRPVELLLAPAHERDRDECPVWGLCPHPGAAVISGVITATYRCLLDRHAL